jgi:hypothetical protein
LTCDSKHTYIFFWPNHSFAHSFNFDKSLLISDFIISCQSYGITGDLLHWLDDYVSDRKQKVVVNNECSNPNTVKAGVPQGSVLGPLLFLLYINDITDNLGNLARLFADDTSLSYFGRNYDIMKSDINNDLPVIP